MISPFDLTQNPRPRGLEPLMRAFTPFQRMLLYGFTITLGLSAFVLLAKANDLISVRIPAQGGSFVEGGVGTPRFVNPLLAVSQTDQDLTTLVYSGLVRENADGTFIPDLAESYDISENGTVYTFRLKKNLTFHDGEPLTAEDILFTLALAQNPDAKSTRRADWEGVTAKAEDASTIIVTLPNAYAPFLENATMGILPKHVWQDVPVDEFPFAPENTHPVGSGPYEVRDVMFDAAGAPTEYTLASFDDFALGEPHISRITYRIFSDTEEVLAAFESKDIDTFLASSPKTLAPETIDSSNAVRITLSRVFGVFLNQNHAPVLADKSVREALDAAVDTRQIIDEVLGGYGAPLDGPIPPGLFDTGTATAATSTPETSRIENARAILAGGGWKFDDAAGNWTKNKSELSITLATADTEELVATAERIVSAWNAAGIKAKTEIYPLQEFNQSVLRPRTYDAILFGEVVGRSLDLFAFWHSSQRNDPGLNLSLYTNTEADAALTTARAESDPEKRHASYTTIVESIATDTPAVFLYAPEVVYVVPQYLQGVAGGTVTNPSERFLDVYEWYRDTERVWDIFIPSSTN
ncbi:MAG: peptide ABC transporter substrate-binding protein [Minisyncoccia bacterium]